MIRVNPSRFDYYLKSVQLDYSRVFMESYSMYEYYLEKQILMDSFEDELNSIYYWTIHDA